MRTDETIINKWIINTNRFDTPTGISEIADTIGSLMEYIRLNKNHAISFNLISRYNPNPQHLIAILRTTYSLKNEIEGWIELRNYAVTYLIGLKYDTSKVMHGL